MQVGSFYEIYGIENDNEKIGDSIKIANLLNIQLTRKNKKIVENNRNNPLMLGFPISVFNKYIPLLLDDNYTVVVIDQITDPPNPKRKVTKILSPGVMVDNVKKDTNNLVSVFLEYTNNVYCAGLSSIDFSIGSSMITELHNSDRNYIFDEIFKFITTVNPSEVIINGYNLDNSELTEEYIKSYLEIDEIVNHINMDNVDSIYYANNYQNDFLGKIYNTGLLKPIEYLDLETKVYSVISFIKLLQFAYEHNENIIQNIKKPKILNESNNLIMLNNTISQLNLIDKKGIISVFSIINYTSTILGKRLLKERLLNPIRDKTELNFRYDLVDNMRKVYEKYEKLLNIMDIDRLHRKIKLGILNPTDFVNIINAYNNVKGINKLLQNAGNKLKKLELSNENQLDEFINKIKRYFNFTKLETIGCNEIFNESFLNEGINDIIDDIQNNINDIITQSEKIRNDYIKLIKTKDNQDDLIKMDISDKDGIVLSMTEMRSKLLLKAIVEKETIGFKTNKSNTKIVTEELNDLSDRFIIYNNKMRNNLRSVYNDILREFTNDYTELFDELVVFVSEIDLTKSVAKMSIKLRYNKPKIKYREIAYIETKGIRHPIIECINKNEKYISNDVSLNKDNVGMLLYGINSSGKSSLLKSIGISLIMAQAGFYVPAKSFEYSPFEYLISRIQGGDNILKGHSSFILEMLELRCILKRSNKKTLVLGDELCRGTEHISALSIVASTILELSKRSVKFIFATHLHELTRIIDVKDLSNVNFYNLSVIHNEKTNKLEYNRKLQLGSGSNMYGLEVAKSMDLDNIFLKKALEIRRNLLNINNDILTSKKSKYNSGIYVSECKICQSINDLDTHHINFQSNADINGNIEHFHKNDKHNLVVLCKTCHKKVHENVIKINGYKTTTNGVELEYQLNINK